MALYGLNYKVPELLFPLDLDSINQVDEHAKAVAKIRFDVGEGYQLLEDVQVNDPDAVTIVDRKLPRSTSRPKILTERVLLLGVNHVLNMRLFGAPSFDGNWLNPPGQFEIEARVVGGGLSGIALFSTETVFRDRLDAVLTALSSLGPVHTGLVLVNLDRMVAGAKMLLNSAGFKEVKLGATLPLPGGEYLLFVNIHGDDYWLFGR